MPEKEPVNILNMVLDSIHEEVLDGEDEPVCFDAMRYMRYRLWEIDTEIQKQYPPMPDGKPNPAAVAMTRLVVSHFLWLTGMIKTVTFLSMIGVADVSVRPQSQPSQRLN
jgi:hypothetical protein